MLHGRPGRHMKGGGKDLKFFIGLKSKRNENPDNHRAHFMPSGHWAVTQKKARPTFPGCRPRVHKGQTALSGSIASLCWLSPKKRGSCCSRPRLEEVLNTRLCRLCGTSKGLDDRPAKGTGMFQSREPEFAQLSPMPFHTRTHTCPSKSLERREGEREGERGQDRRAAQTFPELESGWGWNMSSSISGPHLV